MRGGEQLVTCRLSGLAEAGLPLTPSCQLPNIICRERPQNLSLQGPKEDPRPWALGQALRVEGEAMARLLVREAHLTLGAQGGRKTRNKWQLELPLPLYLNLQRHGNFHLNLLSETPSFKPRKPCAPNPHRP